MTELDKLNARIRSDMAEQPRPTGVRDAFAIAQRYSSMGFDVSHDEIEAAVRKIGTELGYNIV